MTDDAGDDRDRAADRDPGRSDRESSPAGDAPDPQSGPVFRAGSAKGVAIREHWADLIDDMGATAAEFRERGWTVLELHPGDVTVVDADRQGFDVLVPDDEFETLREWIDAAAFDRHDVYLATTSIVFVLVVLRDEEARRAVCCPLYYGSADLETLHEAIEAEGRLLTHVRRLSGEYVTLAHDDPSVFFPEEE